VLRLRGGFWFSNFISIFFFFFVFNFDFDFGI
jgi:hypothetical protein